MGASEQSVAQGGVITLIPDAERPESIRIPAGMRKVSIEVATADGGVRTVKIPFFYTFKKGVPQLVDDPADYRSLLGLTMPVPRGPEGQEHTEEVPLFIAGTPPLTAAETAEEKQNKVAAFVEFLERSGVDLAGMKAVMDAGEGLPEFFAGKVAEQSPPEPQGKL